MCYIVDGMGCIYGEIGQLSIHSMHTNFFVDVLDGFMMLGESYFFPRILKHVSLW